jgi:hypothetical protein
MHASIIWLGTTLPHADIREILNDIQYMLSKAGSEVAALPTVAEIPSLISDPREVRVTLKQIFSNLYSVLDHLMQVSIYIRGIITIITFFLSFVSTSVGFVFSRNEQWSKNYSS